MFTRAVVGFSRKSLSFRAALIVVLGAWLGFSALFILYLPEPWASVTSFVPGIVAVGALSLSGTSRQACYLQFNKLSRQGMIVLTAMFIPMIPVVLVGFAQAGWSGWDWMIALVYAPASGIAQELYFRSALLPALEVALGHRSQALVVTSALFSLFHAGMFTVAPAGAALSALVVTFVVGIGWGWQVQRDQTVIWGMLHHSILQMILRLFAWM
jgi:hypothetical protein